MPDIDRAALLGAQQARALSTRELARLAEVSESHLSHVMAGRKGLGPKTLARVAYVLNVPQSALLTRSAA